jgi:ceramide glucosyltransferase
VTILKPVCGAEPLLEAALASFCVQSYPGPVQIVIGAHDAADPALDAARKAKARFPHADIVIQADPLRRGANGKIANLMNMLPLARHDLLVIADSDLHVEPDYLCRVVAELLAPGTGLVTTLPAGEPAMPGLAARLGTAHLAHIFLPSALIAQALGRQDCLGGTMALSRTTLTRVGGLAALADHLADDNILGRKVLALGLSIRLANTLPSVTVQEASIGALWQHELRWGRTIASVAPIAFAGCLVQYPLFWAFAAVLVSAGQPWALAALALAWAGKAMLVREIETCLATRRARPVARTPAWLLPLRDLLSVAEIVASFCGDTVVWRGRTLHTRRPEPIPADTRLPELAPGL